jgi:hypothetical protein
VVVSWRATEVVSPILVVPTPFLPICARATSEDSAESKEEVGVGVCGWVCRGGGRRGRRVAGEWIEGNWFGEEGLGFGGGGGAQGCFSWSLVASWKRSAGWIGCLA